jgi:hypothetical protein
MRGTLHKLQGLVASRACELQQLEAANQALRGRFAVMRLAARLLLEIQRHHQRFGGAGACGDAHYLQLQSIITGGGALCSGDWGTPPTDSPPIGSPGSLAQGGAVSGPFSAGPQRPAASAASSGGGASGRGSAEEPAGRDMLARLTHLPAEGPILCLEE